MKSRRNKGFSLVELIVVIAFMAILAAVAIPTFAHFITKANEAADIDFMNQLERAIVLSNAALETGEISGLTVYVGELDGSIVEIAYCERRTEDFAEAQGSNTATLEKRHKFEKGDEQTLSEIIDWEYQFKALDSVTDNPDWKDTWEVEYVKQKQPWEE